LFFLLTFFFPFFSFFSEDRPTVEEPEDENHKYQKTKLQPFKVGKFAQPIPATPLKALQNNVRTSFLL
jgi:hypothetical protein